MLTFLCRHDFYWSERHRADRCRRCGHLRAGDGAGPSQAAGLAALLAADDRGAEGRLAPAPGRADDPVLEAWDAIDAVPPVMPPDYVFEPEGRPQPAPEPAAVTSLRNGGSTLLGRIEHLASGGDLSRAETIETLLALIEDGQSSDPVVFGPSAATWYARLHAAAR